MTEKDEYEDWRNLTEEEMRELYNCGNWHNLSEEELNEVYDAQRTRVLQLIGVNR